MSAAIITIILTVVLSVAVYTLFALVTNNTRGCCGQPSDNNDKSAKAPCCGKGMYIKNMQTVSDRHRQIKGGENDDAKIFDPTCCSLLQRKLNVVPGMTLKGP